MGAELLHEPPVLPLEVEALEALAERVPHLLDPEGLHEVALDPALVDRLQEDVAVRVGRDDHAHRVRARLLRLDEELDPGHARHALVRDDHAGVDLLHEVERFLPRLREAEVELALQVQLEDLEVVGLVVDDEHGVATRIEERHVSLPEAES